jgi:tetratricopeptide (TPR) repeat protein
VRFEDYRIGTLLGEGGVGQVHHAVVPATGEVVALKLLPPDRCDPTTRARFVREAASAQAVQHPNVVRVHGFGETPDGGLFLAMELLQGETLASLIARGPPPLDEVVRIGREVAQGLIAVHDAGVVHRDVKPGNVFLCSDGSVKVIDLGLAVPLPSRYVPRLTRVRYVVGTPAYMAFEQANASQSEDAQTDVWGLGATLYEMVSGRTPFEAETAIGTLVRIATDDPDPLPAGVPRWLGAVVMRCLQRSRTERWASMAELRLALVRGGGKATDTSETEQPAPARTDLGDEVRIVSLLFGQNVADFEPFEAAVLSDGGVASRLVGMRAVGVFGGVAWRGDEAERAVRAGLRIRQYDRGAALAVATGRTIQARGYATGLHGGLHERAEAVLSTTGVGADDETRRRILGGFAIGGTEVRGALPGARVIGVRGPAGADVPLVGRTAERLAVETALRRAFDEPRAGGVVLFGPAGIGKSRLVHAIRALAAALPHPVTTVLARGEPSRALQAWHALLSGLRLLWGIPEGLPRDRVRAALLEKAPSVEAAHALGEIFGARFGEPRRRRTSSASHPGLVRDRVVAAIGDTFEALTERGPVLLVVEDLHAVDEPSRTAVDVLVRRLATRPLFVVAAAGPEATALPASLERLGLGELSRDDIAELCAAILGRTATTPERVQSIVERSGGNPFLVEELALALHRGQTELPTTIEAAIQARLDALPRRDKDLLRRASVFGRSFWTEALAALGENAPASRLTRLLRADLIQQEATGRLAGATEFRFRHALTQEVAYRSLTENQRRELHRGAAQWLHSRPDAPALEVATHYEAGGAADAARSFWIRAAEEAAQQGDARQALETSARALERPLDREASFRLRALRCELLSFATDPSLEERELAALEHLAETKAERLVVLEHQARTHRLHGRRDLALAAAQEGLALVPDDVWLLVQRSLLAADLGDNQDASALAERAVAAARSSGDPEALARAAVALAHGKVAIGDAAGALPAYEEALATYKALGDRRRASAVGTSLGFVVLQLGDAARAVKMLEGAQRDCVACGNRTDEGWALHNLGLARARVGQVDEGLIEEAIAEAIAHETSQPRLRLSCQLYRAAILVEAGRAGEALDTLDELLGDPSTGDPFRGEVLALCALALVDVGRAHDAAEVAREALAIRDRLGGMGEFEIELLIAAHQAGLPDVLEHALGLLDDRAQRLPEGEARARLVAGVPANARLVALAARRDAGG